MSEKYLLQFNEIGKPDGGRKLRDLVIEKLKLRKELFELEQHAKKVETGLRLSDEVQSGKNEAVRNALLDNAKGENPVFDKIALVKFELACLLDIEATNKYMVDTVICYR